MTKQEQRQLDQLLDMVQDRFTKLANDRVQRMVRQWNRRYPKRRLKITFGMGTEAVEINNKFVGCYEEYPKLIREAIDDLDKITDGYRRAAPDDVR